MDKDVGGANACIVEKSCPKISVVTPSFQQGKFIEKTIRSVLLQGYPNLEYFIIDGGSSDESVEIIKKYESWLTGWVSEKDRGQAHAINKGFALCSGEWVAWMNSDDVYEEGTFFHVAEAARNYLEAEIIFGNKDAYNSDGSLRQRHQGQVPSFNTLLPWQLIYSETCFFKAESTIMQGGLDEHYRHYMDYELFWRLYLAKRKFVYQPKLNAQWLVHDQSKSVMGKDKADQEKFEILYNVLERACINKSERSKLLYNLRQECLNLFGKRRFQLFRSQVLALGVLAGARLWLRFILSYFPIWKAPAQAPLDLNLRAEEHK